MVVAVSCLTILRVALRLLLRKYPELGSGQFVRLLSVQNYLQKASISRGESERETLRRMGQDMFVQSDFNGGELGEYFKTKTSSHTYNNSMLMFYHNHNVDIQSSLLVVVVVELKSSNIIVPIPLVFTYEPVI